MDAGKRDRQITIEKLKSPPDLDPNTGVEIVSWVPLIVLPGSPVIGQRLWAQFKDVSQSRSETVKADVALSSGRAIVNLRYRSGITSAMRVRLHGDGDDVIYQIITDPVMIGRKEETELIVERYSS